LCNASRAASTRNRLAASFFQGSAALQKNYTSSTSLTQKNGFPISSGMRISVDFPPERTSYPVAPKNEARLFKERAAIQPLGAATNRIASGPN